MVVGPIRTRPAHGSNTQTNPDPRCSPIVEQDDGYDPNAVLVDTITASDDNGADVPYNNTTTNSPIAYLPQLGAFALGKLAGLPAQTTYYLAEAFMLAVYACCTAVAVSLLFAATIRHVLRNREAVFWWCACAMIIGIITLTYLALWLQYTPTDSIMVEGMQHRYFLPMTVLGGLCFAESASAVFGSRPSSSEIPRDAVARHAR